MASVTCRRCQTCSSWAPVARPSRPSRGSLELGTGEQRSAGHLLEHVGMVERDLEVGPREQRVLAAEAFGAGALTALDRVEQTEVVAVSQQQDVARFRQHGLRHHERARARERQRDDPVEGTLEHRASGHPQDPGVEALIQIDEPLERLVVGPVDHLLDRVADLAQLRDGLGRGSALGGEPGRGALEHAAELDRVADVGLRELAHDVSARARGCAAVPRARAPPARGAAASAKPRASRPTAAPTCAPRAQTHRAGSARADAAAPASSGSCCLDRPPLTFLLDAADAASRQSSPAVRLHAKRTVRHLSELSFLRSC